MTRALQARLDTPEDDMSFLFLNTLKLDKTLVDTQIIASTAEALGEAGVWYEERFAALCGDESVLEHAVYAFAELVQNAYEHGNLGIPGNSKHLLIESGEYWDVLEKLESECDKSITIELYCIGYGDANYIATKITDEGAGFDTRILRDTFYRANRFNGRGVFISKKFSNGIYYNHAGNSVIYFNKCVKGTV